MDIEMGGGAKMVIETIIRDKHGNIKEHGIEGIKREKEEANKG